MNFPAFLELILNINKLLSWQSQRNCVYDFKASQWKTFCQSFLKNQKTGVCTWQLEQVFWKLLRKKVCPTPSKFAEWNWKIHVKRYMLSWWTKIRQKPRLVRKVQDIIWNDSTKKFWSDSHLFAYHVLERDPNRQCKWKYERKHTGKKSLAKDRFKGKKYFVKSVEKSIIWWNRFITWSDLSSKELPFRLWI